MKDQQNNAVLRPREPLATCHKTLVQHAETGKDQDSAYERRRDEF